MLISCGVALRRFDRVLLVEPHGYPRAMRERTTQIMFETFAVPAFQLVPANVALALGAAGGGTALVLDVGAAESRAVPVINGRAQYPLVSPAGGDAVTRYLLELLLLEGLQEMKTPGHDQGHNDNPNDFRFENKLVREIKEQFAFVAVDVAEARARPPGEIARSWPSRAYGRDGKVDSIGAARFECCELFFDPAIALGTPAASAAAAGTAAGTADSATADAAVAEEVPLADVSYMALKRFLRSPDRAEAVRADAMRAANKDDLIAVAEQHQVDTAALRAVAGEKKREKAAAQAAREAAAAEAARRAAAARQGLQHRVVQAIRGIGNDAMQRELFENIVLVGGSTRLPGFAERLAKEVERVGAADLARLFEEPPVLRVRIAENAAWAGGCLRVLELRSKGGCEGWWTKELYDEYGPTMATRGW